MTEEEINAILAHEREKKDKRSKNRNRYYYDMRLDYTEYDPMLTCRTEVLTQNSYLEHNRLLDHAMYDDRICYSFLYVPDDTYIDERCSDPCPYPPDTLEGWDIEQEWGVRRYIEEASYFVETRKDNYQFFIKALLFLGMFVLLGFSGTKPLSALMVLGILWIVMPTLYFLVPMYYLAPFSKRKRNFVKAYRYYLNWAIRESRRRHRLGIRNAEKYGLMKPTFWNTIVHSSYFFDGRTFFED